MQSKTGLEMCSSKTACAFFGKDCTSLVAIPIHGKGGPVGVLSLFFSKDQPVPPGTARLLKPIGQLLDMTLNNATAAREDFRTSLLAERQMMASEVHDSLAQNLAFMRMRMNLLEDAVTKHDEARIAKYCNDVNNALGDAHGRLRELITHFRQGMDPRGLLHALQEIAVDFSQKAGILLEIDSRVSEMRMPADSEVQVFHIIQEALTNVMKHAGAQLVRVIIERTVEGFEIRVEDDGVGAAGWARNAGTAANGGHYGLSIMRERAERIGGRVEICSAPGRGSCVRLVFPDPAARAGQC
jgi:two-component system nitrate/nitrite sensor histidine kinase NarX